MNNKKLNTLLGVLVCVALAVITFLTYMQYNSLKSDYNIAVSNNKSFLARIGEDSVNSVVFQATIDQLSYFNDSVTRKLIATKNELGIKDKKIKELSYLATAIAKTDTITLKDTIFKDPDLHIDTIVGDKWVSTHMVLTYPNHMVIEPTVISEKEVILYTTRETVDTPKNFFLLRWLQRKHTVIHATVNEENPHIKSQTNTFYTIEK